MLGHETYIIRASVAGFSMTDLNEGAAHPKVVEKRRGNKCVRRRVKVSRRRVIVRGLENRREGIIIEENDTIVQLFLV